MKVYILMYTVNDAAVLSNIRAVHELTEIVRTSLGPNGRLKLVVNHLGKQALTNNSSTILKEIDVVHPAAKLLVMASQQQEAEVSSPHNYPNISLEMRQIWSWYLVANC
jgi:T-complex protein 1 subunit theta